LFILIHVVGFVWYILAYMQIIKLKKREAIHIKEIEKQTNNKEEKQLILKF
jgi:hypothetical protein